MSDDEHTPTDYRVRRLEEWRGYTDERLEKGANAINAQRTSVNRIGWALFVVIVGAALSIGRVLQRVEDTATKQEVHEERLEEVREDVAESKVEQVRVRSAVERVEEGQDRLELKLDKAIEAKRKR